MSTPDDVRRLALALPEAYEDLHRRRPAFRVRGRIFAMLGVTGNPGLFAELGCDDIAVVKLDRDDQLNMAATDRDAVCPTANYGHHGWTRVRLPDVSEDTLVLLMRLAWIHVAPKRLSTPPSIDRSAAGGQRARRGSSRPGGACNSPSD